MVALFVEWLEAFGDFSLTLVFAQVFKQGHHAILLGNFEVLKCFHWLNWLLIRIICAVNATGHLWVMAGLMINLYLLPQFLRWHTLNLFKIHVVIFEIFNDSFLFLVYGCLLVLFVIFFKIFLTRANFILIEHVLNAFCIMSLFMLFMRLTNKSFYF